ncbi:LaeA-like methyltransferase [Pseudohyphozyma bogoriensis]|nr:LaeA-like methyltransferase [Pseudohyphozyma bogoriensis]
MSNAKDTYPLDRSEKEAERLNKQHRFILTCFSNRLLHPSIPISPTTAVLESGSGTGIWLRAFLESYPPSPERKVVGFDISGAQFDNSLEGVEFFEHSVLERLPEERRGRFDLVHQRLMISSLKVEEWPVAIANLVEALVPGGWLQIIEMLPLFDNPAGLKSLERANSLVKALNDLTKTDLRIIDHCEALLVEAGLTSVQSVQVPWPYGPNDPSPTRAENIANAVYHFSRTWARANENCPAVLAERGLSSEEQRDEWLQQLQKDLEERGASLGLGMFVGQKQK